MRSTFFLCYKQLSWFALHAAQETSQANLQAVAGALQTQWQHLNEASALLVRARFYFNTTFTSNETLKIVEYNTAPHKKKKMMECRLWSLLQSVPCQVLTSCSVQLQEIFFILSLIDSVGTPSFIHRQKTSTTRRREWQARRLRTVRARAALSQSFKNTASNASPTTEALL